MILTSNQSFGAWGDRVGPGTRVAGSSNDGSRSAAQSLDS